MTVTMVMMAVSFKLEANLLTTIEIQIPLPCVTGDPSLINVKVVKIRAVEKYMMEIKILKIIGIASQNWCGSNNYVYF